MKQISQEYFDEMVYTNHELLDLALEEAIEETCRTFILEGVDLSTIIKDYILYAKGHPTDLEMDRLKKLSAASEPLSPELISCIRELTTLSCIDVAHRHALIKLNAFKLVFNLLLKALFVQNYQYAVPVSKLLGCLIVERGSLLSDDQLGAILERSIIILEMIFVKNYEICDESADLLVQFLLILRTACLQNEPVRSKISANGIVRRLLMVLTNWSNCSHETLVLPRNKELLHETCLLLRALTLDDDMSVEFGDGASTARSLASTENTIESFLKLISKALAGKVDDVVAELLLTLSALINREEFCMQFMENDGIGVLFRAMVIHFKNTSILSSCLVLMQAVCRSDKCKRSVSTWNISAQSDGTAAQETGPCGKMTGVQFILQVLERYISSSHVVCKNAMLVLAGITLRQPDVAEMVVSAGGPHLLGQALQIYMEHPSIIRAICMAIRNCVCRTPELRPAFVSHKEAGFDTDPDPHGIEEHLNKALEVRECADEAKAALRDLGCPVVLRELWVSAHKGSRR